MERKCAAIIHESTLVALGLSNILNEMFNIRAVCYGLFSEAQLIEECDIIFLSAEAFAGNIDILLPKKHKCVLIVSNDTLCTDEHSVNHMWTKERIVNRISDVLGHLDDIKKSQGELSKREIDVLKLIVKGYLNKEIADTLNISINTVLTHRKNITAKLGIKSVSGLSVYAMMNGYATPFSPGF